MNISEKLAWEVITKKKENDLGEGMGEQKFGTF